MRPALATESALLAVFSAGLSLAQTTPPPATFGVDVNVVSVTAVVHDGAGHFISGLGPTDVQVYEDGVLQSVSYFREAGGGQEKIPLSVILALDMSGSVRPNLHLLKEAALTFVRRLEDADAILVVDFNEAVRGSAEFANDIERLETFIEGREAWGGTSLYDATHYALARLRDRPGRKALVIFSDGADTTSSRSEREVMAYAQAVEATVYCVGIHGDSGLLGGSSKGFLKKLAQESGGSFFFPDKVRDLIQVFSGISEELHHHYALGYAPTRAPDGRWRKIDVRVLRRGAFVRVRKGYVASRRRPPADTRHP
jgi:Ca-activated chloride channel family protein